ncbi:MAG TPA: FtsX-like permease family protein [Microbacterium sp.]|nr:FtsX-like permease family protein [Microbacterium sp.]
MTPRDWLAIAKETWAATISQPVASMVTVLVTLGMVLTVMLTTGRTVGAEQQVLGSIDSAGTRTIQVRAESGAGLTAGVLTRLQHIEGVEWAAGFTGAVDATNTRVLDGIRVPTRLVYGAELERLGVPVESAVPGALAYASDAALAQLGMPDHAGSVTTTQGITYGVAGSMKTPDFLSSFEPLVLIPQQTGSGNEPISALVVIAERPELVAPVADAVFSVLAVDDPSKVSVHTSEALADLRELVQGQLAAFSRGMVLLTFAITGSLVAVILYGLVMMRRKDFGRRRALGATRGLIIGLLLSQTALLAAVGTGVGVAGSTLALILNGDPLPGWEFTVALSFLAVLTATVAALFPAITASRREPIRELRVP